MVPPCRDRILKHEFCLVVCNIFMPTQAPRSSSGTVWWSVVDISPIGHHAPPFIMLSVALNAPSLVSYAAVDNVEA